MRAKITLIMAVVLAVYLGIVFVVQIFLVAPVFTRLEETEAERNMATCVAVVDREIAGLDRIVHDWSAWDDSYRFVQDRNPTYIETNLLPETFRQNRLSMICFLDRSHRPVWHGLYDIDTGRPLRSPLFPEGPWPEDHPLLDFAEDGARSGLLTDGDAIYLVAARPVLTSKHSGPAAGSLVMAMRLDDTMRERIARQAHTQLDVFSLTGERALDHQALIVALDATHPYIIRRPREDVLHVFTRYADLTGRPACLLRAEMPREIAARARKAATFALLSAFTGGLVLILALFVALRLTLLQPLHAFSERVATASLGEPLEAPFLTARRDELGTLARSFSRLMDALIEEKKDVAVRSYQSGKAEVTGNLLHNIRNGLHPIAAFLDLLLNDVRDVRLDELDKARAELARTDLDPERRRALTEYCDLSLGQLSALTREAEDALNKILDQTRRVIQITQTHKQGPAEDRAEPLAMAELFQDALKQVQPYCEVPLKLTLHPSVAAGARVLARRLALQNAVADMLVFHPDPQPGAHEVAVRRVPAEEAGEPGFEVFEIVHVRAVLGAAKLERLFERGYTEGRMIPDQGLHWCANTINALGGRLRAGQEFTGMTFHLALPRYQDAEAGASF